MRTFFMEFFRIGDVAVRGQRAACERCRIGACGEPGVRVGREDRAVSLDGIGGETGEIGRFAASAHGIVVVACKCEGVGGAQTRQRFGGQRAVADNIAETDNLPCAVAVRVGQHGAQGFIVGVDIGENGVAHGQIIA